VSAAASPSPLEKLDLPPLTARSVLASALLGTPRSLSSRALTALASLFGIAPATSRVALSRMVAAGEVSSQKGRYRVAGPFQRRQARDRTSVMPVLRPWDGAWEMWIVRSSRRNPEERVALRNALRELRYGEHREGVWLRPANLPEPSGAEALQLAQDQADRFSARPASDACALAASLWDLEAWSQYSNELLEAMAHLLPEVIAGSDNALAPSFLVLVAVVHHLGRDPLLPSELLPRTWPGGTLRAGFAAFESEWQALLAVWIRSLR
jgi:phenylacetic acid degradation operon negative regulatory protein